MHVKGHSVPEAQTIAYEQVRISLNSEILLFFIYLSGFYENLVKAGLVNASR